MARSRRELSASRLAAGRRLAAVAAVVLTPACVVALRAASASAAAAPRLENAARVRGAHIGVTGTADVAYAGSLEYLEEKVVGPAFHRATGAAYEGRGAGSKALSAEISSGEISPNVFESVGPGPIAALEPRYTRWYVQFAASPLVLAYNPSSPYAPALEAIAAHERPLADLFHVMSEPGFTLGRTDPNVDPQGAAFVEMVELAQRALHLPSSTVHAILGAGPLGSSSSPEIFDETALEPRLEAGQLDAASALLSQAVQLHLHYVALPPTIDLGDPGEATRYARATLRLADGKVVHGEPLVLDLTTIGHRDPAAAAAFVAYTLSRRGLAAYRRGGYTTLRPTVTGDRRLVPAAVASELPAR
ncbi:MAG: extracellular solute-binding protein [Acidimicrobiales bacterium]